MKNDTPVGASCGGSVDIAASFLGVYCCTDCNPAYYIKTGGSLASNQQTNNGTRDSGNNILHANATSNVCDLSLPCNGACMKTCTKLSLL
jgi:hypothetical protein